MSKCVVRFCCDKGLRAFGATVLLRPKFVKFRPTSYLTMASSSKLSYWFFRDVGFARKLSTGVYFAAKPWIVMGVAVYAGTHLLGYKMERTGHAVEDNHKDVVSLQHSRMPQVLASHIVSRSGLGTTL